MPIPNPTFHALLIGADAYFPNVLSNGSSYRSLSACVHDVHRVRAMLEQRLVERTLDVTELTAAAGGDGLPTGDPTTWPTAANIRSALEQLAERAQPGDQVYVHYSGHGGRVTTQWPELKGDRGVDEALVPIDIGDPAAARRTRPEHYIRDVELALYLDRLASKVDEDRRVTVTLVFDSCHAGGATRGVLRERRASQLPGGPRVAPGGVDRTGATSPPYPAATRAAMADAFRRLDTSATRGPVAKTTWLPPARGYVLLAACRDVETAAEGAFDGRPPTGLLTDALIEALTALGTQHAWRTVYDRVLARVQRRLVAQTPQLLGDIDREVFGAELRPAALTFVVTGVDPVDRRIEINAGLALAITEGVELDIFRPGTTDFADDARRTATVTVYAADATHAYADVDPDHDPRAIELGAPALVRALPLHRKVALVTRTDLPEAVAAHQDATLAAVADAIARRGKGFLELCRPGATPHYQVALSPAGKLEVCDPQGIALRDLQPEVRFDSRGAAATVTNQLRQLCRYHTVLAMSDAGSPLARQLQPTLLVAPPGWTPQQPIQPAEARPLEREDDAYTVANDTWLWLVLTNQQPAAPLNVALMALGQRWEVQLVVPNPDLKGKKYETVDAPRAFSLRMFTRGDDTVDVFKLFITDGDVDFRQLATSDNTRDLRTSRSRVASWAVHEFRIRTLAKPSA